MEFIELEKVLRYEQPTKYIVDDTQYIKEKSDGTVPVLTAGQTFILGYTKESHGICEASKSPVIIFDDFTTASKYVDFDFKVKSSAMKILHPIGKNSIKYFYYLMKNIKFNSSAHKRYWISEYSKIQFETREYKEQIKIVEYLDTITAAIENRNDALMELNKIVAAKFYELVGDIGENSLNLEEKTFGDICTVRQGLQIKIEERYKEPGINRHKYITIQYLNGKKEEEFIESPNNNVICKKEDILMTRTGNTGVVITGVDGVFHNNFFIIDYDKNKLKRSFLLEYLRSHFVQREIINKATTSTIKDLSHGKFYKIKMLIPSLSEQNKFADFIDAIEIQKDLIQKDIEELNNLMETKMNEFFS